MGVVYQHIRQDLNQVFYIGIGKDEHRAHSDKFRNARWKEVVASTAYTVEIVFDGLTKKECLSKERELIALHGRECDGGTLVNISDGGKEPEKLGPNLGTEQEKQLVAYLWAASDVLKINQLARLAGLEAYQIRGFMHQKGGLSVQELAKLHGVLRKQAEALLAFMPARKEVATLVTLDKGKATQRRNTLRTYITDYHKGKRGTPEKFAQWSAELKAVEQSLES